MKTLILPVGIPGIGKTFFCKNILEPFGVRSISSDAIREELYGDEAIQGSFEDVFEVVYERAADVLEEDGVVCIDATNASKYARRKAFYNLKPERVIYIMMDNDIARAKRQNLKRKRHCPEYVINNMAYKLKNEPPHKDDFCKFEIYKWNSLELLDILKEVGKK